MVGRVGGGAGLSGPVPHLTIHLPGGGEEDKHVTVKGSAFLFRDQAGKQRGSSISVAGVEEKTHGEDSWCFTAAELVDLK